MNFYQQELFRIRREFFPDDDLINQIIQAKDFIENNYSKNINLNDIAKEAFFSKYHFIRLFKSIYGQTPYQYLTLVRIKNAKLLLKSGQTITNTCFQVGFDSLSSFTGLFKKITGSTPSKFKKDKAICINNKKT
ncbi:MAG: AraC family transcriptional regulator [Candidatus Sericytochromatia bacterium]